jgi:hypothetical protein
MWNESGLSSALWSGPPQREIEAMLSAQPALDVSDTDLEVLFWTMHPRFRFFKTVARDARLLDIGAANGGLYWWRIWSAPDRSDIEMYGADLIRGELADRYAAWDVVNLDERQPSFPGVKFNAFIATHVIEHLANLESLIDYVAAAAAPGATLYFEWPAPRTTRFMTADELRERGFDIQTFNFYDDSTHVVTYEHGDVAERLRRRGFAITEGGDIDLGVLAREHLVRGRTADNLVWRQFGLWCATGWCAYMIARKL